MGRSHPSSDIQLIIGMIDRQITAIKGALADGNDPQNLIGWAKELKKSVDRLIVAMRKKDGPQFDPDPK